MHKNLVYGITIMNDERVICVLLLCILPIYATDTIPIGMFKTECQDRHFWLSVKSSLLGQKFRFDVEGESDGSGAHTLSGQGAAECGYTMVLDSWGDLVLRASYLACHVHNEKDTAFRMLVWFVNRDVDGEDMSYPLQLTCPLHQPWNPREIVCEENYMEVSAIKQVPPANHKGLEWMTPRPVWSEEGLREWRVVFRVPGDQQGSDGRPSMKEKTLPVEMAHLLGYHINTTETRVLLRCAYGSRLAYILQEKGIEVEVVSATILYKHHWTLLRVDASIACTTNKASMDGKHILWRFPKLLSTLVQPPFRDKGLTVGVEGRYLSDCVARQRGYDIQEQDGAVEIRIPFGAEGGYIKSQVVDGQYSQSYFIDLFYMHQWEDSQSAHTEYRSFRPLSIIDLPQTPILINETNPSEGQFSVSLGLFPHDVSLSNITVGDQSMAEQLGVYLSQVPFPNGTHAYLLKTPFSHHLVSQKYLGQGYRRYSLAVTFTLSISPHSDLYHHPATVEAVLQDVVLPRVEGGCSDEGVRLQLHYGNMDTQWEVYVEGRRLDWELVEMGDYALETRRDYFSMVIPLYGLGMAYEGLSLQGLVVTVRMTLEDRETAIQEHTFTQRCIFLVKELLVCLPDSRMVVVVDTSRVSSAVNPRLTSLLDASCVPIETDGARALYSFSLDSCGTSTTLVEDHLVYTNEVRYRPKVPIDLKTFSSPYPHFSIPIGCIHPANGTRALTIYQPRALPAWPHSRASRSHHHHQGAQQQPFIRGRKRNGLPAGG
ncbi:uncharacterized protein LOC118390624 isoform X1 [Oncorhynchus keta]|uniref:uncharacterized protein LOC118390624 isoform X1 n=1 Tax=Oncorhynchus keta TaxID=8018 RepID=UPI0015FA1484|nr:uncharacterized protein LOC118390624 isoform X1 [Oncorhynchus keta]